MSNSRTVLILIKINSVVYFPFQTKIYRLLFQPKNIKKKSFLRVKNATQALDNIDLLDSVQHYY